MFAMRRGSSSYMSYQEHGQPVRWFRAVVRDLVGASDDTIILVTGYRSWGEKAVLGALLGERWIRWFSCVRSVKF